MLRNLKRLAIAVAFAMVAFAAIALTSVEWFTQKRAEAAAKALVEHCISRGFTPTYSSEQKLFGSQFSVHCVRK